MPITNFNKKDPFLYKLTFGNNITAPDKNIEPLVFLQGAGVDFTEGQRAYSAIFRGVKINRKIYQPCEIEIEMDFMPMSTEAGNILVSTAPSFEAVSALLMQRQVKLTIQPLRQAGEEPASADSEYTIAENYYVHELNPQLQRNSKGAKMYVKLSIYSMDKLMTLNKYSKAYVARKLGSGILYKESRNFGYKEDAESPLIKTNIGSMRFLKYAENMTFTDPLNNQQKTAQIMSEFIHPYLVQYNETFYDFMVRTSNRCGEFLYFEDGKLTLGLPDSGKPMVIDDFDAVTVQDITIPPLTIAGYSRDSVKEGSGKVEDLNHTPIKKSLAGFPNEAFPENIAYNSEIAEDEYIFPLYKDKFTKPTREALRDHVAPTTINTLKTIFTGTGFVPSLVGFGVGEGVLTLTSSLTAKSVNKQKEEKFLTPLKNKSEQYGNDRAVGFGTLSESGWTTINYFNDIHRHEEEQQKKVICINMGTSFIPIKLGQKIKIEGMEDTYVVIQILQNSEEAWNRDYEKYGTSGSDKFSGKRSLKIFAIPAYKEDEIEKFIPPVQPVPIVCKAGPQTAFVVDNEDPKFQGRVRVAYPWQSVAKGMKAKLQEAQQALEKANTTKATADKKVKDLTVLKHKLRKSMDDLMQFLNKKTAAEPGTESERTKAKNKLQEEIDALNNNVKVLEAQRDQLKAKIAAKEQDDKIISRTKRLKDAIDAQEVDKNELLQGIDRATLEELEGIIESKKETVKDKQATLKEWTDAEKDETSGTGDKKSVKDNALYKQKQAGLDKTNEQLKSAKKELKEAVKKQKAEEDNANTVKKDVQKSIAECATPWIRVATPMATPGGGALFKPQIGDEVLINYDNDNVERPYVVGSLFSKNVLEPAERFERKAAPGMQSGRQVSMTLMSPNGHHITFSDPANGSKIFAGMNPGVKALLAGMLPNFEANKDMSGGIRIGDRYGIYEIEMSSHDRSINIKSPLGTVDINAFTGITICANNGDVKIKGKNVTIEAGNKLTLNSGTNIANPGIGDPDFKMGSPVWQHANHWYTVVPNFFANLGRGIRYGVLFLGHQIMAAAPGAVNETMGLAALADLSLVRHMYETITKPVDGTMLIKSKRFLMLEAGKGTAKINHEHYVESAKIDALETFYRDLISCLKEFTSKMDQFFTEYNTLWNQSKTAYEAYKEYEEVMLVDKEDPNILKLAFKEKNAAPEKFNRINLDEKLQIFAYKGVNLTKKEEREEAFREVASPVIGSVGPLHVLVEELMKKFEGWDKDDATAYKKCAYDAINKYYAPLCEKWEEKYGKTEPTEAFLGPTEEVFTVKGVQKLLKRKMVALYLYKVSKDNINKDNQFITLGYDEKDIVDSKLKSDYNWNNFMTHFDQSLAGGKLGAHGNKALIYLLSGLVDTVKKRFKKPTAVNAENKIWKDPLGGQILFSDTDGATLSFRDGSLRSETDANLGNRDQLIKALLAIK